MKSKMSQLPRLAIVATVLVAGCGNPERDQEAIQSLDSLNVIDENNLNEIMLEFGDPDQSVAYFQRSLAENPDRVEFKQGLAHSLARASRPEEANLAFKALVDAGQAEPKDRLKYADSYYDQARGLTTRPAKIFNNWGISKLARGDRPAAEEMFTRAISYDPTLFSAKNNLAISRATRKEYDLPLVPLTTTEQAELLHNIALQAIRNGDVDIGRGLLETAVERHPRHFAEAQRKLEALERSVLR